jgi:phenylalanyl-tRNA synthetase alpha subunit
MKLLSTVGAICLFLLVGLCLCCGGSTEPTTPESEVTPSEDSAVDEAVVAAEEAADDAEATIEKLKAELAEKEADLERLADELKGLSPADVTGEKGQELRAKSEALADEIQQLKDKLESYVE